MSRLPVFSCFAELVSAGCLLFQSLFIPALPQHRVTSSMGTADLMSMIGDPLTSGFLGLTAEQPDHMLREAIGI